MPKMKFSSLALIGMLVVGQCDIGSALAYSAVGQRESLNLNWSAGNLEKYTSAYHGVPKPITTSAISLFARVGSPHVDTWRSQENVVKPDFPGPIPFTKRWISAPKEDQYYTQNYVARNYNDDVNKNANLNDMPGPIPVGDERTKKSYYKPSTRPSNSQYTKSSGFGYNNNVYNDVSYNDRDFVGGDRRVLEDMQRRLQESMNRIRELEIMADDSHNEAQVLRRELDLKHGEEVEIKESSKELFQELMETLNYNKELEQAFSYASEERDRLRLELDEAADVVRQNQAFRENPNGYAKQRIYELENSLQIEKNDRRRIEEELSRTVVALNERINEMQILENDLRIIRSNEELAVNNLAWTKDELIRVEEENRRLARELDDSIAALDMTSRDYSGASRDVSEIRNTMRNMLGRMQDFQTELSFQLQRIDDLSLEIPQYNSNRHYNKKTNNQQWGNEFANEFVTIVGSDTRYGYGDSPVRRHSGPYTDRNGYDKFLINPLERARKAFRK